jgi:hypothetical protein
MLGNIFTATITLKQAYLQRNDFFLFSLMFRPALGPTQPSIQWVTGNVSPEVKRLGSEADHSPPSSAQVKNDGAIPSPLYMP